MTVLQFPILFGTQASRTLMAASVVAVLFAAAYVHQSLLARGVAPVPARQSELANSRGGA
jgi:hypothetical protein